MNPTSPPPSNPLPTSDWVDRAAGLVPGGVVWQVRRQRAKVVEATQASLDTLLMPDLQGLPLSTRLSVAVLACRLSGEETMAQQYQALLDAQPSVDCNALDAAARGEWYQVVDGALRAALIFTAKLIVKPVEGDQAAIAALKSAGMGDAAIVALGQWIAFLSYQIRLVGGLRALQANVAQREPH